MHVLIVPDKFKGTLAAHQVARAIARGWQCSRPEDTLEILPMSDGGDGFGPVLGDLMGAQTRSLSTVDAAHRPCRARWWWAIEQRTAIIETAQSIGLALLPAGRFHPFALDTFGAGRLVEAALKAGATSCLLGVGGSATNDAGFGLARALGWRFLDRQGSALDRWIDLDRLAHLEPPPIGPLPCAFTVATDVSNPLLGREGASRIYGPQKGMTVHDIAWAERRLRRLALVVERELGFDSRRPGSGAAGGLGFGLQAFLSARRLLGFDLFARLAGLNHRVARAELVITAEGAVDASTLMGKGVGQLLNLCARHRKPVILFGGRVELGRSLPVGVVAAASLVDKAGEPEALARPAAVLREVAADVARRAGPWETGSRPRSRRSRSPESH